MSSLFVLILFCLLFFIIVRKYKGNSSRFSSDKKEPAQRTCKYPPGTREERGKQGECAVSSVLSAYCSHSGGYFFDNVTMNFADGTTQIDHVLLTKKGILIIETKNYSGWISAKTDDEKWTQTVGKIKNIFQNPLRQNYKHWLAVQTLLNFLPKGIIQDIVIFTGNAEFKMTTPEGVLFLDELEEFLERINFGYIADDEFQRAIGLIEYARLERSEDTDRKHQEFLNRTFGGS